MTIKILDIGSVYYFAAGYAQRNRSKHLLAGIQKIDYSMPPD